MIQKTFENEGGNICIKDCREHQPKGTIVEMMHLYDDNRAGCVICFWVHDVKENVVEIQVVGDRLTSTKYSFDILEALKYGQQLAEILIKSDTA